MERTTDILMGYFPLQKGVDNKQGTSVQNKTNQCPSSKTNKTKEKHARGSEMRRHVPCPFTLLNLNPYQDGGNEQFFYYYFGHCGGTSSLQQ